ncbi:MAG: hypothetical protein S4CHLAM6_11410 [Chlamydiae bacterium]|nr:hypothetical protein [Chlamydiota bacterium]
MNKSLEVISAVLSFIKDGTLWAYENVFAPMGQFIQNTLTTIMNKSLEAISTVLSSIKDGTLWAYENVFSPVGQFIQSTLTTIMNKSLEVISTVLSSIKDGTLWAYENVFAPMGQFIQNTLTTIMNKSLEVISTALSSIKDGTLWAYENVLIPITTTIQTALVAGFEIIRQIAIYLAEEASKQYENIKDTVYVIYEKTSYAASATYNATIVPAVEKTSYLFTTTIPNSMSKVSSSIQNAFERIKDSSSRTYEYWMQYFSEAQET